MSALFGIVRFDGREVSRVELERMEAALANHGGDGAARWMGKNSGFGQLLRIVTPEDRFEQQFRLNSPKEDPLFFCGRLDNRAELLSLFGPLSAVWAEVSDSEIAAQAFRRWGSNCGQRLLGDFVIVVWQESLQRAVFLRSPLSDRTLFYFFDGNTLSFATSPLGLFALPFVPLELDRERLADYVMRVPFDPDRTFFSNIRAVEGGTVTKIDSRGLRKEAYWQPGSLPAIQLKSDDEYVEALVERFDLAVRARLRSAFPIGAMVSGGIDSSSVACSAATELARDGRRLFAFTQVPRDGGDEMANGFYTDETPFVRAIARMYPNVDLNLVASEVECVLTGNSEFISAGGCPFRNMGNRPWMEEILRRAASLGVRAVLTGAQGNVGFSWQGKGALPTLIRRRQLINAWRHAHTIKGTSTLRTFVGKGIIPLLPHSVGYALKRSVSGGGPTFRTSHQWLGNPPLRSEFQCSMRVLERARLRGRVPLDNPDRDSLSSRIDQLRMTEACGAEICCGFEARHGIELRDPTSDRRVVEFCLSIPEVQFQVGGINRSLPRRAMAKRWPAEVVNNHGRGLQDSDWHSNLLQTHQPLQAALEQLSLSPLSAEILDLDRLRSVLGAIDDMPKDSIQTYIDVHHVLYLGLGLGQFFMWMENIQRTASCV